MLQEYRRVLSRSIKQKKKKTKKKKKTLQLESKKNAILQHYKKQTNHFFNRIYKNETKKEMLQKYKILTLVLELRGDEIWKKKTESLHSFPS